MKTATDTTIEAPPMYETENDLPKATRAEVNTLLNQRLADAVDLKMQLKRHIGLTSWGMPIRPTFSPKSRAAQTNGFGSSRPILKRPDSAATTLTELAS
jgi:hypothetical protein